MPTHDSTERRVLLVDDHEATLLAVGQYLGSRQRWRVRTARTASEAIALVCTERFDAILVDLCLDGATPEGGLLVAEAARARGHCVRIVVLTAHSPGPDVVERIRSVADAFLTKPLPLGTIELTLAGEAS